MKKTYQIPYITIAIYFIMANIVSTLLINPIMDPVVSLSALFLISSIFGFYIIPGVLRNNDYKDKYAKVITKNTLLFFILTIIFSVLALEKHIGFAGVSFYYFAGLFLTIFSTIIAFHVSRMEKCINGERKCLNY